MDVNKLNANNPIDRRLRDADLAPSRGPAEHDGGSRRADDTTPARRDDGVRLSAEARQLRDIEHRVAEQDAFDTSRVERIRAAIAEGRYHVDPKRLAQRFMELELQIHQ